VVKPKPKKKTKQEKTPDYFGQDSTILPTPAANPTKGFDSSRPLTELAIQYM